jgi:hypothetical protein
MPAPAGAKESAGRMKVIPDETLAMMERSPY